jgi:AbrB family looped-hinge helix DNA binding protein
MIGFMVMGTRMKVTRGGQVSIPASIRHRWGTSTVTLTDHGDSIVIRPAPDDPIAAAEGALRRELAGYRERDARRQAREADAVAQDRRTR